MCGRYTLRRNEDAVRRALRVATARASVLWKPRYNVAPTDQMPVLVRTPSGERQLALMGWGIPRTRGGKTVRQINARAEAFDSHSERCAVITDGFYEWSGPKPAERQPYFFHRADNGLLLMAGLWRQAKIAGVDQPTFAIITTAANALVGQIHDRMPAIIEGDALALWLNPGSAASDLHGVLNPAPDDLLEMQPVSPLVNSVKHDGPELLASSPRQPRLL